MLKDVTLGRYCEKEGLLHALNPLLKLCSLLLVLVSIFLSNSLLTLTFPLLLFLILLFVSSVRPSFIFRGFGSYFVVILVFTLIRFALYGLTVKGATEALKIALRLILIILFSSLYSSTTLSDDSARALELLVRPLGIFGVNSRYVSLVFSVALRFIPVLSEQASKIRQAQISRCGGAYGRGSMRLKAVLSLLVPLFASSYRRSVQLSMAMDSRCFSPEGSTHLYELSFSTRDWISVLLLLLYSFSFCFVRYFI